MPDHSSSTTGGAGRHTLGSRVRDLWQRVVDRLAKTNMWLVMAAGFGLGAIADRTDSLDPYAWVFYLAGGFLPVLLQTVSTDEDGYDHEMSHGTRLRYLLSMGRWSITPWGVLTQVLQPLGTLVAYLRYRGKVPNRDRHVPDTDLRLPVDGEWTTVNGGVTQETSHSWGLVAQRYAYDFLLTDDEGETHAGEGEALTDYYAFGEPIRAPADGTVVSTVTHLRDYPRPGTGWFEWRTWQITGNYVVIEHTDGEYSLLAHLQQDSVTVDPGDRVEAGDMVGRCGSSGISSEPHLHFQLQDHPNFWICAGLVPRFRGVAIERDDDRAANHDVYANRENGDDLFLWAGDRVSAGAT